MKRILAVLVWATISIAPSFADGPPRRTAVYEDGRPAISWAGYYVGIQGGVSSWDSEHSGAGVASGGFDFSNGFFGATWGSSWQRGPLVYGFESDLSFVNGGGDFAGTGCGAGCFTDVRYFGTSRVRLGYAMDRVLIYTTGGLAHARVHAGILNSATEDTRTRYGWTLGAGIEWMFAPRWSAKIEYQHLDYGDGRNYYNGGNKVEVDLDADIVRVGVNYRIDLPFLLRR